MFSPKLGKIVASSVMLAFISFGVFFNSIPVSNAQILVNDTQLGAAFQTFIGQYQAANNTSWSLDRLFSVTLPKMAAKTFNSVLSTALKQVAYDTATWLGSGAKGQGPMFLTQGWGPYLSNIGDVAAGQMIEGFANEAVKSLSNGKLANFSFCSPSSMSVSIKIGLGLRNQERPLTPTCTLSKISKDLGKFSSDKRFLGAVQDMFDPTSNDLGVALNVNFLIDKAKSNYKEAAANERTENKGWLRVENLLGDGTSIKYGDGKFSPKTTAQRDAEYNAKFDQGTGVKDVNDQLMGSMMDSYNSASMASEFNGGNASEQNAAGYEAALKTYSDAPDTAGSMFNKNLGVAYDRMLVGTGDALVDAANTFLNQLALTAFQNMMKNLGGGKGTGIGGYAGDYGAKFLTNKEAGGYNPGVAGLERQNSKLLVANYGTKADYDILAALSLCPNPNKAGPTECVLSDQLRQAIEAKKSVGQAMEEGKLSGDLVFGFLNAESEPKYNEGLSYRSMLIMRKYRILPVGWELAAQYIKKNIGSPTVPSALTLKDLVNCFSDTDLYTGYNQTWCHGLVDPNWVLKATKQYCGKEGFGSEIASQNIDSEGNLTVDRKGDYCADEQSCIKEGANGMCELYGYCTEDRRTWSYGENAASCEPVYNTCKTFVNAKTKGSVSYLQNTLNYNNCNIDTVGCADYCNNISFNPATKYAYNCGVASAVAVTSNGSGRFFFDYDAKECSANDDGCHQFIRTKAGLGVNLLVNSDFEAGVPEGFGVAVGSVVAGGYNSTSSLRLATGLHSSVITVGRNIYNQAFTLSFYAKGCSENDKVTFKNDAGFEQSFFATSTSDWSYVKHTRSFAMSSLGVGKAAELEINWNIAAADPDCRIDNVKLEYGSEASSYAKYGDNGMIYEKVAPSYLGCTGADTDPSECAGFARICGEHELDCELYTSKTDGIEMPAKVSYNNYCVKECVGYKSYVQTETRFDSARTENIMPNTATKCSLDLVGCDEFTNLASTTAGGEAKEYYSYLKQCVKPEDTLCRDFYTWQGSTDTGFRLVTEKLKATAGGKEPAVTEADTALCNEAIYNLAPSAPGYNPDCLQYYDKDGNISYHLRERTITCSDSCQPYRRTAVNYDEAIPAAACAGIDRKWDADKGQCMLCKNGGEAKGDASTGDLGCVYTAIPNQGRSCSAAQNGCREYVGNQGENMRIVMTEDFESGLNGWAGNAPITIDKESLLKGKSSLKVSYSAAYRAMNYALVPGRTYVLSFLIKGMPGKSFSAYTHPNNWTTGGATDIILNSKPLTGEWQTYKESFTASSTYDYTAQDWLVFDGGAVVGDTFYIDNIRLTEVSNRYYLLKDSSKIPESCDQDLQGQPDYAYMLNCDAYTDRDDMTHYLRSFAGLCAQSGAGCELMIDTHNSDSAASSITNGVTTPVDNYEYVVFDKNKQCSSGNKGCSRFGLQNIYAGTELTYTEKFIVNNPDNYSKALCAPNNVNCEMYTGTDGSSNYFKNPINDVCEYRVVGSTTAWYKQKVKRCKNGLESEKICTADNDCTVGGATSTCAEMKTDILCPVDSGTKTVGPGMIRINQPTKAGLVNWTGICDAKSSGCTEIIDPVSKPAANMLKNPTFADLDANGSRGDSWTGLSQDVILNPNTLYYLAGKNTTVAMSVSGISFQSMADLNGTQPLNLIAGGQRSRLLYTTAAIGVGKLNLSAAPTESDVELILKKATVNYQIIDNLDQKSCNGVVNYDNGCVPFNVRSYDGGKFSDLKFDADQNDYNKIVSSMIDISATENDANAILKVNSDRVCNKWLTCSSKIVFNDVDGNEKNYCTSLAMCDNFNTDGTCAHVVNTNKKNIQTDLGAGIYGDWLNYTGYTKAGYINENGWWGDYYLGDMKQKGEFSKVPNGDFENYVVFNEVDRGNASKGAPNYKPSSWEPPLGKAWTNGDFTLVTNAVEAQKEGILYPVSGKAFLKLGSASVAESAQIKFGGRPMYLYFSVNTKNLHGGWARISIKSGGANIAVSDTPAGLDWTTKRLAFTTNAAANVVITTNAADTGLIYVDNVRLTPGLNSTCTDGTPNSSNGCAVASANQFDTPADCRLYPESDSLACEYTKTSGLNAKGLYGYCLEHDRYPGNGNTCLLWWPVDKIKGDGISEEGAGYQGPTSVYYCSEANALVPVVRKNHRQAVVYTTGYNKDCSIPVAGDPLWSLCNKGYDTELVLTAQGREPAWNHHSTSDQCRFACSPNGALVVEDALVKNSPTSAADVGNFGWYEYQGDGVFNANISVKYLDSGNINLTGQIIKFYDPATQKLYDNRIAYCTQVVRTVTEAGENKFWSGRVYANSPYKVQDLNYIYYTDLYPFGSMVTPNSLDPVSWNGSDDPTEAAPILIRGFAKDGERQKNVNGSVPYRLKDGQNRLIPTTVWKPTYDALPTSDVTCTSFAPNAAGAAPQLFCKTRDNFGDLPGNCSSWINIINKCQNEDATMPFYSAVCDCTATTTISWYNGVNVPTTTWAANAGAPNQSIGYCVKKTSNVPPCASGEFVIDGICSTGGSFDMCLKGLPSIADYSSLICKNGEVCVKFPNSPTTGVDKLRNMYAQSYGVWEYDWGNYRYEKKLAQDWFAPVGNVCPFGTVSENRDASNLCGILPTIPLASADSFGAGNMIIHRSGFARLVFTSVVDMQQRPLTMYEVQWGDGESDQVAGVQLSDRPNTSYPHKLFHLVDYWTLKSNEGICGASCNIKCIADYCEIQPDVMITDNWGFSSVWKQTSNKIRVYVD
ncbi:MAG: carbohydrate binding domain-containing protein [bacterium]